MYLDPHLLRRRPRREPKHLNMELEAVLALIVLLALIGGIVKESAKTH
jgi:hypothetical protein